MDSSKEIKRTDERRLSSTLGRSLTRVGVVFSPSSLSLSLPRSRADDDKKNEERANLYVRCCNLFAARVVIAMMVEVVVEAVYGEKKESSEKRVREERTEGRRRPKQPFSMCARWRVS